MRAAAQSSAYGEEIMQELHLISQNLCVSVVYVFFGIRVSVNFGSDLPYHSVKKE